MRTKVVTAVLGLTVFLSATHSWAHDESMHKAKPTRGRVAALQGETLTLATDNGEIGVVLTPETKVEQGDKDVGRDALKAGTAVDVFGTIVPGQGLVAKEIMVGGAHGEDSDAGRPHKH